MKFCSSCGKELGDRAAFCSECGAPVFGERPKQKVEDKPSWGLNLLSFIIPLFGLIFGGVVYRERPNCASECLGWALASIITNFLFGVILIVALAP